MMPTLHTGQTLEHLFGRQFQKQFPGQTHSVSHHQQLGQVHYSNQNFVQNTHQNHLDQPIQFHQNFQQQQNQQNQQNQQYLLYNAEDHTAQDKQVFRVYRYQQNQQQYPYYANQQYVFPNYYSPPYQDQLYQQLPPQKHQQYQVNQQLLPPLSTGSFDFTPRDSVQKNMSPFYMQYNQPGASRPHTKKGGSLPGPNNGGAAGSTVFNQYTFKRHSKSKSLPMNVAKRPKPGHSNLASITATSELNYPIHQLNSTGRTNNANATTTTATNTTANPSSTPTTAPIPQHKSDYLQQAIYPLIEVKKYSTSAIDPLRNYLTVYEYLINNHWIIWDYETGFVHLTGIWKAALCESNKESLSTSNNLKADIVKLLESTPRQYHQYIKRIRGGFLKIQGTWLPYELCKILARRFCYHIRYELVPIFGVDFVDLCLRPADYGYGELRLDDVPVTPELAGCALPAVEGNLNLGNHHQSTPGCAGPESATNTVGITPPRPFASLSIPSIQPPVPVRDTTARRRSNSLQRFPTDIPVKSANSRSIGSINTSPTNCAGRPEAKVSTHDGTTGSKTSAKDDTTTSVPPQANYDEMMDMVNALRCLQSLRKCPATTSLQELPINYSTSALFHQRNASVDSTEVLVDNEESSYTIASVPYSSTSSQQQPPGTGMSTILQGAELSEESKETPQFRKPSMKINDLLT